MAAPITHIALTQKIFDKFFGNRRKKDFFVGTCFPDIRYPTNINRDKTHFEDITLNDLKQNNSFWAGLKFHSILDIVREKFIVKNNIYSFCPKSQFIAQSLKIVEDQIFYQRIKNWQEYIDYLNKILPEETKFGITKKDVQKWHELLQEYFANQPNKKSIENLIIGIGLSKKVADEINQNIKKIKNNNKVINIINNLYKNFDSLLK